MKKICCFPWSLLAKAWEERLVLQDGTEKAEIEFAASLKISLFNCLNSISKEISALLYLLPAL